MGTDKRRWLVDQNNYERDPLSCRKDVELFDERVLDDVLMNCV